MPAVLVTAGRDWSGPGYNAEGTCHVCRVVLLHAIPLPISSYPLIQETRSKINCVRRQDLAQRNSLSLID
jgi:hypothetical protein